MSTFNYPSKIQEWTGPQRRLSTASGSQTCARLRSCSGIPRPLKEREKPQRTSTEEIAEEDKTFVDRLVPDRLWVDTEYTARVSLDALARNKMRVVPGPLSQAMSVAGNYVPRGIMAPIVGRFYAKLGEGQQGGA